MSNLSPLSSLNSVGSPLRTAHNSAHSHSSFAIRDGGTFKGRSRSTSDQNPLGLSFLDQSLTFSNQLLPSDSGLLVGSTLDSPGGGNLQQQLPKFSHSLNNVFSSMLRTESFGNMPPSPNQLGIPNQLSNSNNNNEPNRGGAGRVRPPMGTRAIPPTITSSQQLNISNKVVGKPSTQKKKRATKSKPKPKPKAQQSKAKAPTPSSISKLVALAAAGGAVAAAGLGNSAGTVMAAALLAQEQHSSEPKSEKKN